MAFTLRDVRIEKMAQIIVHYSLGLEKGDLFLIRGSDLAAPLIKAVYREALKAGAHPEVDLALAGLNEIFLKEADEEQLDFISPLRSMTYEEYDCMLSIGGTHNTRAMSGIDPARQARRTRAGADLNRIFMERSASGALRWCVTQFPTHASAQDAGMSIDDYADFVFRACRVLDEDPVEVWESVRAEQDALIKTMSGFDVLRIVSEDTDITMRVGGRTWINAAGEANFPDGEIFTGPVESSVEGHIRFSFPAVYAGNEVEDIRLTFREGRVVEATAARGQDVLRALLDTDEGAKVVGELGIGTNFGIDRFTRNMLFDEKMGGTIHLALGAGYPETGNANPSSIHWDMLCDMKDGGEIYADGTLIYREGKFLF